jgi:menaquinone-specific isochorismate synthase
MRSGLPEAWRSRWLSAAARTDPDRARALTIAIGDDEVAMQPRDASFRFSLESSRVDLSAAGAVAWFRGDEAESVGRSARAFLDAAEVHAPPEAPPPLAVGGRAFETGSAHGPWRELDAASLVVPRISVQRRARAWATLWLLAGEELDAALAAADVAMTTAAADAPRRVTDVERDPQPAFEAAVRDAIERIRAGEAAKVVLSRRTRLFGRFTGGGPVGAHLERADPGTARFQLGFGERTFLGSTPELLVRRVAGTVDSEALAGSAPPEEGSALSSSAKDREEHRRVVEHVAAVARRLGASVRHPEAPSLRQLGYVTHLWTPIRIEGRPDLDVWQWAEALHPTPAVGGWPPDAALDIIRDLEPHPRGWYCGAVGWLDAAGDGELFVALRSALVEPESATLFVGVGVVAGSDPAREWRETRWKERAMLQALGASETDAVPADPS